MSPDNEERRDIAAKLLTVKRWTFDDRGEMWDGQDVRKALGLESYGAYWFKPDSVIRLAKLINRLTCRNHDEALRPQRKEKL